MCKLLLKSEEFTLPLKFEKIGELSYPVFESLTGNEKKYEIKSNVSKEAILLIVDYLKSGDKPEVHINNIFELNQLAQELGLEKITILIKEKLNKWRQFENNLENQTFEKELKQKDKDIHDLQIHIEKLYQMLNDQSNEINSLKNQLQDQEIKFNNSLKELEIKLIHKNEELISQVCQESSENYELKFNEIGNTIEIIQNEIQSKESQMQEQSISIQENYDSVNILKNQIEKMNDQFSAQKNSNSQTENEFNAKLYDIGLKIEELKDKYITKDI